MGNSCSGGNLTEDEKEKLRKNKDIEKYLKEEKKMFDGEIKLLLLGSGESGKSTIAKQMKILYLNGFTDDERRAFLAVIHSNIIMNMRTLLLNAPKYNIEVNDNRKELLLSPDILFDQELSKEIAEAVQALWALDSVKSLYALRSELQVLDSTAHFFDHVTSYCDPNYIPTDQDVLLTRARTVGCVEIQFSVGYNFRLVDVGGQISERRKWIDHFANVNGLFFIASLIEYDMKMMEDDKTNRMKDSLQLFGEILSTRWFDSTAVVLFLNKKDLFDEKILQKDLNVCFPEYSGGMDKDAALSFIRNKYLEKNSHSNRNIYTHVTCATDTENVKKVFSSIRNEIVSRTLEEMSIVPV